MTTSLGQYNLSQQLTSCTVQTTTALTANYYNGVSNQGIGSTLTSTTNTTLTIDGVLIAYGNRVFVEDQAVPAQNGIYIMTAPGSSTTPWVLTRSEDFQSPDQIKAGYFFTIESGTTNQGNFITVVAPAPVTIGVSTINFIQSGASAGTFLTVANNLSDVPDDSIARTNIGAQDASRIKVQKTASWGGGSASHTFVATGLTTSSIVVASIFNSANVVSFKCDPQTDSLEVIFSGDPGAGTIMSYIAFAGAQ